MERFSLRNKFFTISHAQFISLASGFKQALENGYSTPVSTAIRGLTSPKEYTSLYIPTLMEEIDHRNNQRTLGNTDSIESVTHEMWNKAKYLEIIFRPIDPTQAPESAFAHAEFKGAIPHQATFYAQCMRDASPISDFIAANQAMRLGDGFDSNSVRGDGLDKKGVVRALFLGR